MAILRSNTGAPVVRKAAANSRNVGYLAAAGELPPRIKTRLAHSDNRTFRRGLSIGLAQIAVLLGLAIWLLPNLGFGPSSPVLAALDASRDIIDGKLVPATAERTAKLRAEERAAAYARELEATRIEQARLAEAQAKTNAIAAKEKAERTRREAENIRIEAERRTQIAELPRTETAPVPNAAVGRTPDDARPRENLAPSGSAAATDVVRAPSPAVNDPRLAALPADRPGPVGPNPSETTTAKSTGPKVGCLRDVQISAQSIIITFDFGSAVLAPVYLEQLKRFAALLSTCPQASLEIAGHTDSQGVLERNFALSWQRAESVMTALKKHGVDVSRFTPIGYGPRRPLASATEAVNDVTIDRRVELILR
jgi:outer membrane protein OmpA-like peptidoglycan-associated protein